MIPIRTWRWPIIGLVLSVAFGLACNGDNGSAGGGTGKACNLRESQPPTLIPGSAKG